jgi:hypothetical protein
MPSLARQAILLLSVPRWFLAVAALVILLGFSLRDSEQPAPGEPANENPSSNSETLDRRLAAAQYRTEAKRRIAQQVGAGRLTLREAAERYRDLNATNPDFDRSAFESKFPGPTEKERCCQQVIAMVEVELVNERERARSVRKRLEASLEAYRQNGSLAW